MTEAETKQNAKALAELAYPLNADSPYAAPLINKGLDTAFQFFDMTGLNAATIDSLIPTVLREAEDRDLIPVFLTDLNKFDVFRRHGVIFEALPDVVAGQYAHPHLDWGARRAECLSLIEDKWKPQGTTKLAPGNVLDSR